MPVPRCVRLLLKHMAVQFSDGISNALSERVSSQTRHHQASTQESAKRFDGLLPSYRARVYRCCFQSWFELTQESKVVDRQIVLTLGLQGVTKLTSTTFSAWRHYIKVPTLACDQRMSMFQANAPAGSQAWANVVRCTGLILQPLLPLSVRSAVDHWKRRRHLPKVRLIIKYSRQLQHLSHLSHVRLLRSLQPHVFS